MKKIVFQPDGTMHAIYDERITAQLGTVWDVRRASHVEARRRLRWWQVWTWLRLRHIPLGDWYADLAPVRGPVLGPFRKRSAALEAELAWLVAHWCPTQGISHATEGNTPGKRRRNRLSAPPLRCACGCGTITTNYYRHFIAGKYFWFHAPCYEQQLRREARDRAD